MADPEGDKGEAACGSDSATGNGATNASANAAHGTHGADSLAKREIERSRGYPASGSDAAVMGRERTGDGGVGANQRLNRKGKEKGRVSLPRRRPSVVRR